MYYIYMLDHKYGPVVEMVNTLPLQGKGWWVRVPPGSPLNN